MRLNRTVPRIGLAVASAAVLAVAGATAGLAVTGLPDGKENTVVIAQNAGTANADIVMDVYTPGGVIVPSASRPALGIAPGGTATFAQAVNNGLQPGFRGVGVLSSNQPINGILVRDILASRAVPRSPTRSRTRPAPAATRLPRRLRSTSSLRAASTGTAVPAW